MKKIDRRKAIKNLTYGIGGVSMLSTSLSTFANKSLKGKKIPARVIGNTDIKNPVTAITLGAGNRGNVYGNYGIQFPNELNIIGVAEPISIRNERYSKKHTISKENRFTTWEQVFDRPKFADAIIITTPDDLHYGPCMKALEMGYDVLLEKPIAPTEKECRDILALANKKDRNPVQSFIKKYKKNKYFKDVINNIKKVLRLKNQNHIMTVRKFGKACSYPGTFMGSIHAIITSNSYKSAITKTIKAGGCNCSRANFVGAYFAALKPESIPSHWVRRTLPAKNILKYINS